MKRWLVAAALLAVGCGGKGTGTAAEVERPPSDWVGHRLDFQLEEDCGDAPCRLGLGEGGFWIAVSESAQLVRIAGYPAELPIVDGRAELSGTMVLADYFRADRWYRYALESLVLSFGEDGSVTAVEGAGMYQGADECACSSCAGAEQGTFAIRSFAQKDFKRPELRLASSPQWPGDGDLVVVSATSPWKFESAQLGVGAARRELLGSGAGGFDWASSVEGADGIAFGETTQLTVQARDFTDREFATIFQFRGPEVRPGERSPGFEALDLAGYAASDIAVVPRGSLPGSGAYLAASTGGRLGFPVAVPQMGGSLVLDAWAVGGPGQLTVRVVGDGEPAETQLEMEADQRLDATELSLGGKTVTADTISEGEQVRVDLTPWAGKQVAVVISLQSTGITCGVPASAVLVDEVRIEP